MLNVILFFVSIFNRSNIIVYASLPHCNDRFTLDIVAVEAPDSFRLLRKYTLV